MNASLLQVIVADDHPLYREGLKRIVSRLVNARVTEVENFKDLLSEITSAQPEIILLDLIFPGLSGPQSIAKLRQQIPMCALIVISMDDDPDTVDQIMKTGVNGFISKAVGAETMSSAIEAAIDGDTVCCLESQDGLTTEVTVSPRQTDILIRLRDGKTNKEIARELSLSPFTVRAHISTLFKVLDVSTRTAAVTAATENGII
jgi:two-component system nitrate/nitrite response regulator NarL